MQTLGGYSDGPLFGVLPPAWEVWPEFLALILSTSQIVIWDVNQWNLSLWYIHFEEFLKDNLIFDAKKLKSVYSIFTVYIFMDLLKIPSYAWISLFCFFFFCTIHLFLISICFPESSDGASEQSPGRSSPLPCLASITWFGVSSPNPFVWIKS